MKALFDFFPVILFYITYQFIDIYVATSVLIAASLAQVIYFYIMHKRIEKMHIVVLAAVLVLGVPTLIFRNELFIKWKPTAVNWIAAVVFAVSQGIKRPIIRSMLEDNFALPDHVWSRLNLSWISFFLLMGFANLFVVYNFDTQVWVNFKFFGVLGLTICFAILQGLYLTQYIDEVKKRN